MITIALASESTIRRRVYSRFAWDKGTANRLAYEIATVSTAGYDARLRDYAKQIGLDHPVELRDTGILDRLTVDARGTAFGVLQTHNRDLRAFLAQQPAGLSQRELSARTADWQQQRAVWKTKQVAATSLQEGRNQAQTDVMALNNFVVLQRAEPQSAGCPICQGIVARGWLRPDEISFSLPAHPSCRHSLVSNDAIKTQAAARERLWLGQWAKQGA